MSTGYHDRQEQVIDALKASGLGPGVMVVTAKELQMAHALQAAKDAGTVIIDEWSEWSKTDHCKDLMAALERYKVQVLGASDAFDKLNVQMARLQEDFVVLAKPEKPKPYYRAFEKRTRW